MATLTPAEPAAPPPRGPRFLGARLLIWALLIATIAFVWRQVPQPEMQILGVTVTPAGEALRVRIECRNVAQAPQRAVYFVLTVFDAKGRRIASSLSCPEISGPWIGEVPNEPGAMGYVGVRGHQGHAVLAYDVNAAATVNCEFILTDRFAARYGTPARYTASVGLLDSAPLAETGWYTPIIGAVTHLLARGPTGTRPWQNPLLLACLLPLALFLLSFVPFLGPPRNASLPVSAPRARRLWAALDALAMLLLVVVFSVYFVRTLPGDAAGREVDTFDYLCIAERFGPPLDACIRGMDDRGYDRRAYLHRSPDRGWGLPLMISVVARFSGSPAEDAGSLLFNFYIINIIALLLTSAVAAWTFFRYWTPSAWPCLRSACVFAFLLFDGYNYTAGLRVMTEVPSRFIFSVCMLSWAAFWASGSVRWQSFWIALGTMMGFAALTFRPEHAFVEPAIVPLLVLLKFRSPAFKRNCLTWLLCAAIGGVAVSGVSYVKFGTWKPATGSGLHMFAAVHRLSRDGGIYRLTLPPGIKVTDEQKRIYDEWVTPAAKLPGGYDNPSFCLPAIMTNMTPKEISDFMADYTLGILRQNLGAWWYTTYRRYVGLTTCANIPWPNREFTKELQLALNRFGFCSPAWYWPAVVAAWMVGRWLWGRRYRYPIRSAALMVGTALLCLHIHALVACAVGGGDVRHRHFVSAFIPALGAMIALDSLDIVLRQLAVMVARWGRSLLARLPRRATAANAKLGMRGAEQEWFRAPSSEGENQIKQPTAATKTDRDECAPAAL